MITDVKEWLFLNFQMKDMGEATFLLGVNNERLLKKKDFLI